MDALYRLWCRVRFQAGLRRLVCGVFGHPDPHWHTVVDDATSRTPLYEMAICSRCVVIHTRQLPEVS